MYTNSRYYLALDIGGTKTSGALFTADAVLVDDYVYTVESQTFKGEEAVYHNSKGVLDHVIRHFALKREEIAGIGVGSPGPLDSKRGVIIHAPLMRWRNFPLVERLKADFETAVMLDNDGNLGALAEQRCGAARGLENVLYMTVSTGCGGGFVLNGRIYRGHGGGAGEVGHMSLDPDGPPCPCGSRGCFELYASGTAMNRMMREDMKRGVESRVFELAEGEPERISGKVLHQAALLGDWYALDLLRGEGRLLGRGIANLFNLLDPDVIVLGGGVTKSRAFFHDELMDSLKKYCIQQISGDSVRYSVLNDRVILYGAFYLVSESI
ncbi:MAG: ROK family protein [Spirochaetaceae bacterium]|jgi:glucokinase|nr:ROK family protein [Spirochaetaceae bacterium]